MADSVELSPETSLVEAMSELTTSPSPAEPSQTTTEEQPTKPKNNKKMTSSVAEFGNRRLTDEDKVWDFNAWDNVPWGEEEEQQALKAIERQKANPVPEDKLEMYDKDAAKFWDAFYAKNQNNFFKDRHWLDVEFPEIFRDMQPGKRTTIMEVGCGAGNTVFPLLESRKTDDIFVYACDFSATAIDVVKSSPSYDTSRCEAFVFDITADDIPPNVTPHSVDILTCIFVLSAVNPSTWPKVLANFSKILKPGGILLFRDYGRYDLTQLRLKGGRLLQDNFYIRGDGTRVYFFTQEEVVSIFGPRFKILSNDVDRRLLVNRARKVKMHRIWIQSKLKLKQQEEWTA